MRWSWDTFLLSMVGIHYWNCSQLGLSDGVQNGGEIRNINHYHNQYDNIIALWSLWSGSDQFADLLLCISNVFFPLTLIHLQAALNVVRSCGTYCIVSTFILVWLLAKILFLEFHSCLVCCGQHVTHGCSPDMNVFGVSPQHVRVFDYIHLAQLAFGRIIAHAGVVWTADFY